MSIDSVPPGVLDCPLEPALLGDLGGAAVLDRPVKVTSRLVGALDLPTESGPEAQAIPDAVDVATPPPCSAIIVHGEPTRDEFYDTTCPCPSNSHWIPWMQKELQVADVLVAAPDMPFAFDPHWATWVREVERYEIGPSTALVGHSTGAGFWVGYLGAHPELRVGRVALVAPWIDPYDEYDNNFFDDCIFDPLLTTRVEEVAIFVDPDDIKGVVRTVELLVEWIPGIRVFSLPGYGHFTTESMGGVAFPELAEFLLPGE